MDEEAIAGLQELGLSLYEARLYLGLLIGGPQNGNELSRTSSVPSSKVYSTLDKIVASGIVQQRRRGTTTEYICAPPDEVLRRLRAKYTKPLEYLETALPTLAGTRAEVDLLRTVGEQTILEHARALIDGAETELFASMWDDSIDALRDSLSRAEQRGVRTFALTFGDVDLDIGFWLRHGDRERVSSRIAGQMLTIVADGRKALIAHVPEHGEATGVETENPVLCLVVEEYLRHDLVIEKTKTMNGFERFDSWLEDDDDVRAIRVGPVDGDRSKVKA